MRPAPKITMSRKIIYQMNNIHDVNLIKGSFYMLEIPLTCGMIFT